MSIKRITVPLRGGFGGTDYHEFDGARWPSGAGSADSTFCPLLAEVSGCKLRVSDAGGAGFRDGPGAGPIAGRSNPAER